jgi:Fe(3+) dicitrate transport protein
MNSFLRIKFILFLCCGGYLSLAQMEVSGVVYDEKGNPKEGVEIQIQNTNVNLKTDASGMYSLQVAEVGTYQLIAFTYGYQIFEKSIQISRDTLIDYSLIKLSQDLSEVVILDQKERVFNLGRLNVVEGTRIYAGKKNEVILVDQLVGNKANNNARQVYSQIVGLNIYESGDGGLQLSIGGRGLDPNRSANFNTRQNGYDISPDVLGYPESYYTPPAEALSQIQVVRGAASLQYGTQFGGLINFKMHTPVPDKKIELIARQSVGSFNFFSSFNSLSGTTGKLSYYTYYHHKQSDGFRPNSVYKSNNTFTYLNYQFNLETSLSFEYTYLNYLAQQSGGLTDTRFDLDPMYSNRTRNWFEIDWNLAAINFNHNFSSKTKLSAMIFGLVAERNSLGYRGNPVNLNSNPVAEDDYKDQNGEFIYNRDLIAGTFRNYGAELRFLSRYKLKGTAGVFLLGTKFYKSRNTAKQGPGSSGSDADFDFKYERYPDYSNQSDFTFPKLNFSFFGENIFFINEKFAITPGFRFEYIFTESEGVYSEVLFDNAQNPISNIERMDDRSFNRSFVLFGLGLSYTAGLKTEWYANISQNYRSVTFSDIRTVSPTFIVDPDITDEQGYTLDLGLRSLTTTTLNFDVSIFGLLYDDRIGIILDDRANRVRKNIGEAFIYGLEIFGDVNLVSALNKDWKEVKWSIFVNTAFTESSYLFSEENNVTGKKVEFIPILNFKSGVNFGFRNFMGSLQWIYLSEQFTDVENSTIAVEGDNRNGLIGEIPSYHVMDLSFAYSFKFFKIESGINNLMNTSYFTRRATSYPGPGIIPSESRSFYTTLQVKF